MWPYVAIVAVVFAVYGQTLFFDLVYFDDDKLILGDQAFLRNPANVGRAFQRDVFGDGSSKYRPLLTLSLMLDAWASGTRPVGYHLSNVALHAAASAGVFLFLVTLGYPRGPSGLAGIVFAVHPVLTSGVAWIPGRNDSLLTVFALAAWLALTRYIRSESPRAYAAHVVLFAAALFTKETALALPLVAACYSGLLARESLLTRRAALLAVGWLAIVIGWLVLRQPAARRPPVTLETLALNSRWILELLGSVLLPVRLPAYPMYSAWGTAIGVVAVLLLAGAVSLVRRERMRHVLFGVTWFVLLLVPTLTSRTNPAAFEYLHHRAYLPLVGLTIVALEVGSALRAGRRVAIALAVILAGLTIVHARQFRDGVTFWSAAAADAPRSADVRYILGNVLHRHGDLAGAEAAYRAAIALEPAHPRSSPKPNSALARTNLGGILYSAGRLPEAESEYLRAIEADPRFALAYTSLCGLCLRQNRLDEAERFCRTALGLQPDAERAMLGLAIIHYIQKRYPESIARVDQLRARGVPVDRVIPDVVNGLGAHRSPGAR
jgi:tetratricopeptide (TPR) repeat protein